MPTDRNLAGGVFPALGLSQADWQADPSTDSLSGDWGDGTRWSTGVVPDDTTPVVISDGAATGAWLVTETSQMALSLLLDMHLGTLEVSTLLGVTETLSQQQGTLLVDAGGLLDTGGFDQTGGSVVLADDGTGTTAFVSGGTDSVNGTVTLQDGAQWQDERLSIGAGPAGSSAPVSATFTLTGGAAAGTLDVDGNLQIGGDPSGTTAGGVGSLEVDGGSSVDVDGLSVLDGSEISVDAGSDIDIQAATVTFGAINVGASDALTADIATLGASVVNAGSIAIVGWQGLDTTEPGYVVVTGSLLSTGTIMVAALATLSVDGSIELDPGGSLSVGSGGTLETAAAGVQLLGGQLTLDGAVLDSLGTADLADCDGTLFGGALWTTGGLAIAAGDSDGSTAEATVMLSGASSLRDGGSLGIGADPGIGSAESSDPGGLGTLALSGASHVTATDLAMFNGSALTLDAESGVSLGGASAAPGAVAVGAGSLLFANIATIGASVDDSGSFDVAAWAGGTSSAPGSVQVTGSLTGTGVVTVDGTLELGDASTFAGSVTLGDGSELRLDGGDMAGAPVSTSSGTGTIVVAGQALDSAAFTPTYDAATGLLVFGNAISQSTLDVGAGHRPSAYALVADGDGTLITETPCYLAGTRIRAEHGEVPVEGLRAGDRVRTLDGRLAPVRWVGRRRIDLTKHPRPWRVAPIRIAAGAIGAGVPCRDLLVSPDHALFVGGALVPVAKLANGATIARQDGFATLTYLHLELDRHDILLAENCPAESYLDTGNRGLFANWPGPARLHPDFPRAPDRAALWVWATQGAAPLLLAGDRLARLRAGLAARALALGWTRAAATRPVLLADAAILPMRAEGEGAWRVGLHPAARRLHLCSESFVPSELFDDSGETRRLGLAVRALVLDGASLPPDAFGPGWHDAEDGFRWSDGRGEILLPARSRRAVLRLVVAPEGQYWRPPPRYGISRSARSVANRSKKLSSVRW